jgi:hypothetical protein
VRGGDNAVHHAIVNTIRSGSRKEFVRMNGNRFGDLALRLAILPVCLRVLRLDVGSFGDITHEVSGRPGRYATTETEVPYHSD